MSAGNKRPAPGSLLLIGRSADQAYLAGVDTVVVVDRVATAVLGLVGQTLPQVVHAVPAARPEAQTAASQVTHLLSTSSKGAGERERNRVLTHN